jgi:hypothetical protein
MQAYNSVGREVLYNILIKSEVSMKIILLIRMCLNGTHIEVPIDKDLSITFLFEVVWNNEMLYCRCLNLGLEHTIRKVQQS